jgi:hypothetical protein
VEVLVGGQVSDLDLEQIVVVAGDVVGVHNFGQSDDRTLERDHVRAGVPHEPDTGEHPEAAPDSNGIDQRPVTADYPGLLQSAYPPQTR